MRKSCHTYLATNAVGECFTVGDKVERFLRSYRFVLEKNEGQGGGVLSVHQGVAQQLSHLDRGHDWCNSFGGVIGGVRIRARARG